VFERGRPQPRHGGPSQGHFLHTSRRADQAPHDKYHRRTSSRDFETELQLIIVQHHTHFGGAMLNHVVGKKVEPAKLDPIPHRFVQAAVGASTLTCHVCTQSHVCGGAKESSLQKAQGGHSFHPCATYVAAQGYVSSLHVLFTTRPDRTSSAPIFHASFKLHCTALSSMPQFPAVNPR
jgi:hypothetical protein